jgi:hypothetical protein
MARMLTERRPGLIEMKTRLKRIIPCFLLMVIGCIVLTAQVWGQAASPPMRTQCKQWDDAFLALFNYALLGTVAGTFLLALLLGFLGKNFWWCAAPRLRIIVVTLTCLTLVVLGIALGPWVIGLGHYWFGGVDARYYECEGVAFGAEGFFGGLIGAGVAVIVQWPIMLLALSAAAILGGILAWIVSELVNRLALGVPAKVKGEMV